MGAPFKSQYYNKACPYCGEPIPVGAMCSMDFPWGQKKVVHSSCAGKWQQIDVPTWTPVPDQHRIWQWFDARNQQRQEGRAVIKANPGSGKTATLKLLATRYAKQCYDRKAKFLRPPMLIMAFDNEIVKALRQAIQLPGFCQISTFHSFGGSLITGKREQLFDPITKERLSPEYKLDVLFKTELHPKWRNWSEKQKEESYKRLYQYKAIISKLQAHLLTPNNYMESLQDIADMYDISLPDQQKHPDFYQELHRLFELNLKHEELVSYDDMIYFPFYFNLPFPAFQWVGVDEGQDQSPARQWMVWRLGEEKWQESLS